MIFLFPILFLVLFVSCSTTQKRTSWDTGNPPVVEAIYRVLRHGNPVKIIVQASCRSASEYSSSSWVETCERNLHSDMELYLLNISGSIEVVDRAKLKEMLKEILLSSSGAIEPMDQLEIGRILGATHFLSADLNRFIEGYYATPVDYLNMKLTEVETGRIVAFQRRQSK